MDLIFGGLLEALNLIVNRDPLVWAAAGRTLFVSCSAVSLAAAIGLPSGVLVANRTFPGRTLLITLARTGMAVPTVFVGIFCYAMLSRRGPLGNLDLLITSKAIIIGEFLLALPIIFAMTQGAVSALDPRVRETAKSLGAGFFQGGLTLISEARTGILLGVLTALARCMTELGIAILVGGNIEGKTRTLSTATALETSRGEFARGMAMGVILLLLSLSMTAILVFMSREKQEENPR